MVSQSIEKIKELAQQGEKCPNVTFAQVQKPAPSFTTMALVNGEFKEVSLESYAGMFSQLLPVLPSYFTSSPTTFLDLTSLYRSLLEIFCL